MLSCACLARVRCTFVVGRALSLSRAGAARPDASAAEPPAHISVVDGAPSLERDGRPETSPAVDAAARRRSRAHRGRPRRDPVRRRQPPCTSTRTTVDFQSDEVVRLLDGRVRLIDSGPRRERVLPHRRAAGWVQIRKPASTAWRSLGARPRAAGRARGPARRGGARERRRPDARCAPASAPSPAPAPRRRYAYVFNSAAWDAFDRWSESAPRSAARRLGAVSARRRAGLRRHVRSVRRRGGTTPTYGYVWYPARQRRLAAVLPRPLGELSGATAGRGSARDPWAWPTHHYGRWGFSAGAWFWIPGRTWAPAWVSWAYAPGYVSWCPLGWNNRPVLQFVQPYYGGGHYDPGTRWTVVPQRALRRGYVQHQLRRRRAHRRADARRVRRPRRGAPQVHGGYAVPRNAAPIRVAGSRGPARHSAVRRRDESRDHAGPRRATAAPSPPGGQLARPSGAASLTVPEPARHSAPAGAAARPLARGAPAAAAGTDARTSGRPEVIRGGVASTRPPQSADADRDGRRADTLPAPSRGSAASPEAIQRTAAPRAQTAAPRTFDPRERARLPRRPCRARPISRADATRGAAATRTPVAGVPAERPAGAAHVVNDDRRTAPAPGYRSRRRARPRRPDRTARRHLRSRPRAPQPPPRARVPPYGGEERRAARRPGRPAPRAGAAAAHPESAAASDRGPSRGGPARSAAAGAAVRRGGGTGRPGTGRSGSRFAGSRFGSRCEQLVATRSLVPSPESQTDHHSWLVTQSASPAARASSSSSSSPRFLGIATGVIFAYAGDLPQISALDDYAPSTITRVYGARGEIVGEFAIQRREVIPYEAISPKLRDRRSSPPRTPSSSSTSASASRASSSR